MTHPEKSDLFTSSSEGGLGSTPLDLKGLKEKSLSDVRVELRRLDCVTDSLKELSDVDKAYMDSAIQQLQRRLEQILDDFSVGVEGLLQ